MEWLETAFLNCFLLRETKLDGNRLQATEEDTSGDLARVLSLKFGMATAL